MRSLIFAWALLFVCIACTESPRSSRGGRRPSSNHSFADASTSSAADAMTSMGDARMNIDGSAPTIDGGTTSQADASAPPSPQIRSCLLSCSTSADCSLTGPLYTSDHYLCKNNTCHWTGCASDNECQTTFQDMTYVCDLSLSLPGCVKSCASPNDCITPNTTLFDADNYACTNGTCEWTGCTTDTECHEAYQNTEYTCVTIPGTTLDSCMLTCTTANDCAQMSPIVDQDNYQCNDGLCHWTGCNNNMECADAYQDARYVCADSSL
jgi:hypothetical protein